MRVIETYQYEGTTATRIKSGSWNILDNETGIDQTLTAQDLTNIEINTRLDALAAALSKVNQDREPLKTWPAFIIAGLANIPALFTIPRDYQINADLVSKLNGLRATIGMAADEVDGLYGKPQCVKDLGNTMSARIFGKDISLRVDYILKYSQVAGVFKGGRVIRVYSHGFLNPDWCE